MSVKTVWARRPIKYLGQELSRGEVFNLGGAINDEKLLRLGYVAPVDGEELYEYQGTGRMFIDMQTRQAHGDYERRLAGVQTPADEDRLEREMERRLEEAAPLYIGQRG